MSETLHIVKTTVSQPNREQDRAVEQAIQALQSQLADLRMLVRAARTSDPIAATKPQRNRERPDDRPTTSGQTPKGAW